MIRVGFLLGDVRWIGGLNYYRNLLIAIQSLPEPGIKPVVFAGLKSDMTSFEDLAEIIRSPILDRYSLAWWISQLCKRLGRNYPIFSLLKFNDIDVLSHADRLWRGCSIPSLGWIPDFQHIHFPNYFDEKVLARRDSEFKAVIRDSSVLLFSSQDALNDLNEYYPDSVTPTCILRFVSCIDSISDDSLSVSDLRRKYDLARPWFYVPNQFWQHKNHKVVVEAMLLLKKAGRCPLVIATGDAGGYRSKGYYESLMDSVRSGGLQNDFLVLGRVPYVDVAALMKHSLAVINPSLFEGWSTSVEEAKALGKSIILSDIAVHVEQNPERGYYFHIDNPESLARAIELVELKFDSSEEAIHQNSAKIKQIEKRGEFGKRYESIILSVASKSEIFNLNENRKKKRATFSVITATYNAADYLPSLIQSLREQTDKDFEWVVADGGSDDGTLELLQAIDDLNIVISSQQDFGIYDALNRGIKMTSCDYYVIAGADDIFDQNAILKFRRAIDSSDADIVIADAKYCGKQISIKGGSAWLFGQSAFVAAHTLGTAFRKDLHSLYGFYSKKFPIAADQLFIMRACEGGASRYEAGFVSGEIGSEGVSSIDNMGTATEVFRVQVSLGRSKFIQAILMVLRLLK